MTAGARRAAQEEILLPEDRWWLAARAMRVAGELGFDAPARARIGVCVAELVSNVVKFAGRGTMRVEAAESQGRPALLVVVEDDGPGIGEPAQALVDGWSEGRLLTPDVPHATRRGLGIGLGAIARLASEVRIQRRPKGGTRVEVWLRACARERY